MRVLLVATLLQVIAAITAGLVARRRAQHLPLASFLIAAVIANLALVGFIAYGAPTSLPAAPLTGIARFVGHVRQGLYLVWPFGFAMMFVAVFSGRHLSVIPLAYVVTLAVLVLGYPTIGGEVLRQVYLGIELAALAVALAAIIQWAWRRESPTLTHGVALLLLSGEAKLLLGPWHHDIFAGWDAGRIMYATIYLVIAVVQVGVLWTSSESKSSESP
jgi:hypothetical protein